MLFSEIGKRECSELSKEYITIVAHEMKQYLKNPKSTYNMIRTTSIKLQDFKTLGKEDVVYVFTHFRHFELLVEVDIKGVPLGEEVCRSVIH
jgi:hypothetical protein